MKLKIKDAVFEAEPVDYRAKAGGFKDEETGLWLPPTLHIELISVELKKLDQRIVTQYRCFSQDAIGFHTDANGKVLLQPWVKIRGLTKSGNESAAKDRALLGRLLQDCRLPSPAALFDELKKQLGSYALEIPFQHFLQLYGPEKSFTIALRVDWVMARLKLPGDYPKGLVVIAYPYRTQFVGHWTFNCKTGKRRAQKKSIVWDLHPHKLRLPNDTGARPEIGVRIKDEIKTAKADITRREAKLAEADRDLEAYPESERAWDQRKEARAKLREAKARLKARKEDKVAFDAL